MPLTSPFSGYTVDRLSRRLLITLGLTFWSLICAATALSRNFVQLIFFRGGRGPGRVVLLPGVDVGPGRLSRAADAVAALSIHQTSVYLGTAGGAVLAGYLGERLGWRSPFWVLGLAGMVYAVFLGICLVEPARESTEGDEGRSDADRERRLEFAVAADSGSLVEKIGRIVTNPAAALLLWWFSSGRISWRPRSCLAAVVIFERFDLGSRRLVVHLDVLAARQSAGRGLRRGGGRLGRRGGREGAGSGCRAWG